VATKIAAGARAIVTARVYEREEQDPVTAEQVRGRR
jgi:hypothetical protein